ncbi:MAG: hypothetical protein GQ557_01685 [Mycoplasmataceae bacterium]|nr:hypothetical protein [Mycoplasmataceae bacterium]
MENKIEAYDIGAIYKTKNKNPRNELEFMNLFKKLHSDEKKYYSIVAEKRRSYTVKKIIKLKKYQNLDKNVAIFTKIANSILYQLDKNANYDSLKYTPFLKATKNKRIYKIEIVEQEIPKNLKNINEVLILPHIFCFIFIESDVIYWEKIELGFKKPIKFISKKNIFTIRDISNVYIKYLKTMKTPFPMEPYNLQLNLAKRTYKKNFNNQVEIILRGLDE